MDNYLRIGLCYRRWVLITINSSRSEVWTRICQVNADRSKSKQVCILRRILCARASIFLFCMSMLIAGSSFARCTSIAYADDSATPCIFVSPLLYVSKMLGETFEVNVNVSNVENLHAVEFKIGYNTTLLNVVQVVQGPFFPLPPESTIDKLEIDEANGLVWFDISLSDSTQSQAGGGILASIIMEVAFAPAPLSKACCILDLHETRLHDNTMGVIVHSLSDGLYFWKSMLDDPDGGLLLDLTTQKGGIGVGQPSPPFALGEIVELSARLTFNDLPEIDHLVGFEVLNPSNETVLTRTPFTDNEGVATIEFRIPDSRFLLENLGTWKAIAISEVKGKTVWDILYFEVKTAVGGNIRPIETHLYNSEFDFATYVLPIILVLSMITVLIVAISKVKKLLDTRERTCEQK